MRILYLVGASGIPACGPSGASAHVRGITAGLQALGHAVDLVTACEVDARGHHEDPSVPWQSSGVARWPRAPRAVTHLREVRTARGVAGQALAIAGRGPSVDLVVERHALYSDAGLVVARKLGVPCILEVNAPQRRERQRFEGQVPSRAAARWERRVLRSADGLAAVSAWLAHWLRDEVGIPADRIRHLSNGVAPHRGDRDRGRASAGLDDDAWVLGFVGAFRRWHGLHLLPDLLEALPQAHLLLVGAGRQGEEALWQPLARHPRVAMAGRHPQHEVADLVAAMDVGLAPYPHDAPPWLCPLKLLEYRAQGTPAVASDIGDCRLLVGEAGTIVPPGAIAAMAQAAVDWRGRRAEPWVRSWEDVATELLEAFGKRPRPG